MYRLMLLLALLWAIPAGATVDKLPESHDAHVAAVEAALAAPPSEPIWAGRPGTIKDALTKPDGTVVTLDCVRIKALYSKPQKFFIIYDWYTAGPALIVDAPTEEMNPGQVVDVIGTISSLPDGRRIIVCPTVLGYTDSDLGNILIRGGPMTKGTIAPVEWPYKIQLY